MNRYLLLVIFCVVFFGSDAQQIEWQKCFGGSGFDGCEAVQQTSDGGYIVTGFTESNDGDVSGNHGDADYWVLKLDRSGGLVWQKCLGGSIGDWGRTVFQTDDGGYVVAGHILSFDGDVSCNNGLHDFWIAKLDSNGVLLWEHCYGGGYEEEAHEIRQTADGGFIVAGSTLSNNGWVSGNHGWHDFWVLKLNDAGLLEWQKCYGGTETEKAFSVDQCPDGGYVVAGHAWSNDGDVSGNHGGIDSWVIRIDDTGTLLWQKCLGGSASEYAQCVRHTDDGGFIVASSSHSNDGEVMGNHGGGDCWMVKLDSLGSITWQKCYGGSYLDFAKAVSQTHDGGYIVAGNSESFDGDVSGNYGFGDYWVIRLGDSGQLLWEQNYGGMHHDAPYSVQQTLDMGYIVAGVSNSNDQDVSGNHGSSDFWLVKISDTVIATSYEEIQQMAIAFEISPNPVREVLSITSDEPVDLVSVFDMAGNLLAEQSLPGFTRQAGLDVSPFSPGIYFLQVRTRDRMARKKFVKL